MIATTYTQVKKHDFIVWYSFSSVSPLMLYCMKTIDIHCSALLRILNNLHDFVDMSLACTYKTTVEYTSASSLIM